MHLTDNDTVFGRYIWSDRFRYVPGFFGGVLDGTSTSAWGSNYLKSQRRGRRLDEGARLEPGQRSAHFLRPRHQRRHAGPVRRGRQRADRLEGRSAQSRRPRRRHRHRHRRAHPDRVAQLHAEVPAHQPGAVDRHAQLGEGAAPGEVRRRPDAADEQRVLRRGPDPRQHRASPRSSPATPSPTSCSATCSARS